ncbi:MAG: 16S rRNA processing protein RimM [Clostridia bacterium]|nr:16S rRNA processing protein RimM [Clostridia bacterium]MBN2884146.1 16S rRNA processing protein RimM [Clostridia bacterium]
MDDRFEIGKVAGGHGLKGELKVFTYTDDPANLLKNKYFYCGTRKLEAISVKLSGHFLVVGFREFNTKEQADALKGTLLYIDRDAAAPLDSNSYYIRDLLGCEVYESGNLLGVLDDVIQTGANDVYSVIPENGVEILIPAIKSVVRKVDVPGRRIDVVLPEGLVEGIDF